VRPARPLPITATLTIRGIMSVDIHGDGSSKFDGSEEALAFAGARPNTLGTEEVLGCKMRDA
jgi:hypothetical protein